jgi:hypothetical protein
MAYSSGFEDSENPHSFNLSVSSPVPFSLSFTLTSFSPCNR